MRNFILFFAFLVGCTTVPKAPSVSPTCGQTPVVESDMAAFGFKTAMGKIVVMRIFASWCPFCKTDLDRISTQFKSGKWNADQVSIFLLAYSNHGETRASFNAFVKEQLHTFEIPASALQIQYVDKPYAD